MKNDLNHILVVDDESSLRRDLSEVLREEGYQVSCAANAEEALALFDQQHFELVFCDIVMPGMSGIELLQKFKARCPAT